MSLKRIGRHLLANRARVRRAFSPQAMAAIEQAIKASEASLALIACSIAAIAWGENALRTRARLASRCLPIRLRLITNSPRRRRRRNYRLHR